MKVILIVVPVRNGKIDDDEKLNFSLISNTDNRRLRKCKRISMLTSGWIQ